MLYIASTFPALTHTFVLREIRQLRQLGMDVAIGQLRPLHRTPAAKGFEDLTLFVSGGGWSSVDMLKALVFFSFHKPVQLFRHLRVVLRAAGHPKNLVKMAYILLAAMKLAYRFRNANVKHVRAHFLHTEAIAARFVSDLLEIPYSLTAHTVVILHARSIMEEVVRGAAFLVADTNQVASFLLGFGVDPSHVHLIRNGVLKDEFVCRQDQRSSDPPILLAVGRLDLRKGFHILLSACQTLVKRGVAFHCVIIGDGDERNRLIRLRRMLSLDKQVELLGNLSLEELRHWYRRATVLVVPCLVSPDGESDGLPTVVIEAMASGLPVIGTITAGIPEAIENEVTGFLVPAQSAEDLAKRIEELLKDIRLRLRFAGNGRMLAEREFDLTRNVAVLQSIIQAHEKARNGPVADTFSARRFEVKEGFR